MPYINTDTRQYPVSEHEIREAFPDVSFPVPFQAPEPFAWVFPSPLPAHDPVSQAVREGAPALTDKGHYEQQWIIEAFPDEVVAVNRAAAAEQALFAAKAARHALVAEIKVTTAAGRVFDGDEDSQNRMSRAINGLDEGEEMQWILSDSTEVMVSRGELREALRLAGIAMTSIWVVPYLP